jgi:hypothetical protein
MTWNSGAYVSITKNGNIILVVCMSYKIWDDLSTRGKKRKGTPYGEQLETKIFSWKCLFTLHSFT